MITTVLFDFDGVIADSVNSIFKWFQHAASVFNIKLPIQSTAELKKHFFEPFPEFYKFLGFQWEKDLGKIYKEYIAYHSSHPVTLIDGIESLIDHLSAIPGLKLGIVSSNIQDILIQNLKVHGLEQRFDVIKGVDKENNSPLKPDPTLLLEAIDCVGARPEQTVYIGDQPSDVLTAHNASQARNGKTIHTVSITTGFASRQKLESCSPRADFIIDHPVEVLSKLEFLKN